MAALMKRLRLYFKCQDIRKVMLGFNLSVSGLPKRFHSSFNSKIFPVTAGSLLWHLFDFLRKKQTHANTRVFGTLAQIENKEFQRSELMYYYLLIRLEGLDYGVLDTYSQFIGSASQMMSLKVSKQFNLATEVFTQTLANPPDNFRKHSVTYFLKKHGRIVEVKDIPVEKADIFIQYLQDNVPEGVSVHLELKKWLDYVSPPDPRILEEKRLEYQRVRERKKKAMEE